MYKTLDMTQEEVLTIYKIVPVDPTLLTKEQFIQEYLIDAQ